MSAYPTIGSNTHRITNGVASVDCQKQVRSWRLLRSLLEFLIPSCNCIFIEEDNKVDGVVHEIKHLQSYINYPRRRPVTGTIFGYRRGKVSFCIQANSKSTDPILLIEFAVPTAVLAREMQGGVLRIALECNNNNNGSTTATCDSVLSVPQWTMHCNGRRVGYAVKRRPSKADLDALRLMSSVVVGAGMISGEELDRVVDDELMYLRASFDRVRGSSDSESFHLIDPDGNIGQELSIFFFRKS